MKTIKLLIVDDQEIMRRGLALLLNAADGFSVAGDAADGASAVRLARKLKPDVIVCDLVMPGMNGAETTRRLVADDPGARVVILTAYAAADGIGHALDAGARGALLKSASCRELIATIRAVAAGETAVAAEIRQRILQNPPLPALSRRQLEMLDSLVRGLSNEDIARAFGIAVVTVKKHLMVLFRKMNVANRAEATALALEKRLVRQD